MLERGKLCAGAGFRPLQKERKVPGARFERVAGGVVPWPFLT